MKIIIRTSEEPEINLSIPNWLVLNHVTTAILSSQLKKHQIEMEQNQLKLFIKEIQKYKNQYPEWTFLEAQSADGEYVEIRL